MSKITDRITYEKNKFIFGIKKNSPEILLITGVVSGVTAIVYACYKTYKNKDEIKKSIKNVKETTKKYKEEEATKEDIINAYKYASITMAKTYFVPAIAELASVLCITKSHSILKDRNIALGAAYAVVDNGFKEYRERVKKRYGEEIESEIKNNVDSNRIEDQKDNKTESTNIADINYNSTYSRFFDETCIDTWEPDSEANRFFLNKAQTYFNDILHSKGYVFLNEIYEYLGMPKSRAGQVVGWIDDKEKTSYIDFGIFDVHNCQKRCFVNGREKSVLLDFNVQGNILDTFEKTQNIY